MQEQFSRTAMLLGEPAMERLARARVAVFGVGGVGGYVVEALARSGVGTLEVTDNDSVSLSNLNRQILATHATLGMRKVEAARRRVLEINPRSEVVTHDCFLLPETADEFDFTRYDFVVDAVDTVAAKLTLAERCTALGVPLISCMGTGNKLDPEALHIMDLSKTSMCPLARVMRYELRKRGIRHLTVLCSEETPLRPLMTATDGGTRRDVPGSTAFVPAAAGLMIAGYVVRKLTEEERGTF